MTNNDAISKLKKERGRIKASLTVFTKFLNDESKLSDLVQLKTRTDDMIALLPQYQPIQTNLEDLHSQEEFDALFEERTKFMDDYYEATSKARTLIINSERMNNQTPTSSISANSQISNNTDLVNSLMDNINFNMKMPTTDLPKFNNTYEAWPAFVDAFKYIYDNTKLSEAVKLGYLKRCLTGKALDKIESLETIDSHFSVAWGILEKSFNDPIAATNKRIEAIFDIAPINKATDKSIGELLDTATKHFRGLEALKKPFLEMFPIYAIVSKLDESTRIKWKAHIRTDNTPTVQKLLDFLHERQKILEESTSKTDNQSRNNQNNNSNNTTKKPQSILNASSKPPRSPFCNLCKGQHFTDGCDKLSLLSPTERFEIIKNARLCINCFRPNHAAGTCQSRNSCKKCNKKHHTSLHRDIETPKGVNIASLKANTPSHVLLSTAIIDIKDKFGKSHACRVLLDTGSQINIITEKLANLLDLPVDDVTVPIVGIHQIQTTVKKSVNATISSKFNNFKKELSFLVMNRITDRTPSVPIRKKILNLPKNIRLADPQFDQPGEVDALLGNEIFYKLLCVGQIPVAEPTAVLQKTHLGWILAGKLSERPQSSPLRCNVITTDLDKYLTKFWEIEEISKESSLSIEEQQCEKHYTENTVRDPISGKFTVRLPFNEHHNKLGNSYDRAVRRFHSLERSFDSKPELWAQYVDFMNEYKNLDHMVLLNNDDTSDGYYLPHHAVLRESSLTTKLRVVFDASAKTTSGYSINDLLFNGPTVQDDLLSITLRFRTHKYVITADAEKMYRQILMHPDDQKYQKIVWRETKNEPLKTYALKTVTYGYKPSMYHATRSLHELAESVKSSHPTACHVLKNDFYVDDLLTGCNDFESTKKLRDELITISKSAGINLRKWASNDEKLVADLGERDNEESHLLLDLGETIKALRTHWNAKSDKISYSIRIDDDQNRVTKRTILSQIARLFDPLGLLGPVIVKAKMLIQILWKIKVEWDESVPADISTFWHEFLNSLPLLEKISVPRNAIAKEGKLEIHGFCDTSEKAYGACLYIRSFDEKDKGTAVLLNSKSRVAPVKARSIPRLELCAAELLSDLLNITLKAIKHLNFEKVYLWSDSTIVLHWLKTPSNTLKTFVQNRVAHIQEVTVSAEWKHVRSADNPADLISRGVLPGELINNSLWFNGPSWLSKPREYWPKLTLMPMEIPEKRKLFSLTAVYLKKAIINFERFSSFKKLQRTVAYVFRFVNIKLFKHKFSNVLEPNELEVAARSIVKIIQREVFGDIIQALESRKPYTGKLSPLNPFVDGEGVLRVGGRLNASELPFERKHPMLLPPKHHVTNLLIREYHIDNKHAGTQATLNAIRQDYWVIDGKNSVKSIIHKCILCFRVKPKTPNYIMGNLPENRVKFEKPFLNTGVDLCGPFFIKEKRYRNRNKEKVYVCIFVCFATKAVHIELVSDLSTETFLAALRRFLGRRGPCANIYSDNGTNFVGAKREIDEIYEFFQSETNIEKIKTDLAHKKTFWHFIPPRSPHFGGLWEAAVKSFKHLLLPIINDRLFTYDVFQTFTIEIEAILNSRPLVSLSSDPNDLRAFTPGHFLTGDSLGNLLETDFRDVPSNRLSCWQTAQQMKQHFWSRWTKEYLNELTVRKKWHKGETPEIKPNALVLLNEDNAPPLQWKLGRVIETFSGDDGKIRAVTVKTATGSYKRCVKKISPLPMEI